jgi:hypothetical protein
MTSLLLLLLAAGTADAHLFIRFQIRGPAGVGYAVRSTYTGDEYPNTTSGFIPPNGLANLSVFGYVPHDDGDTLSCDFDDGTGSTVRCADQAIRIFEPAFHFDTDCVPVFTFEPVSRTCTTVCMSPPASGAGAKPVAYPNPLKVAGDDDAVQFKSLTPSAKFKIFDWTGHLVWQGTTSQTGTAHWHLQTEDGRNLGSGVYRLIDEQRKAVTFAIQR